MSKTSLITQIAMIVIAIAIGFIYIKPTVGNIKVTQDNIDRYNTENDNVSKVNATLKSKIDQIDSVTNSDLEELTKFVPDQIDSVMTLKDIQNLINYSGLSNVYVTYKGSSKLPTDANVNISNDLADLKTDTFSLTAVLDYNQLKKLLALIEVNDYLLQVTSLNIKPKTSNYFDIAMTLTVFSKDPTVQNVITE